MDTSKIVTAWRGLEPFAHWLVQTLDPAQTVELGVDYGFSLIELSRYNNGVVTGFDWFQGDVQAGHRDVEAIARKNLEDAKLRFTEIVKSTFDDAAKRFRDSSIDLLHIDGAHDLASVEHDLQTWYPKVRPGGVILLHDTRSFPNDVGQLFNALTLPKFEITHSHGLGVVTKV